jgi:hypothetical protein
MPEKMSNIEREHWNLAVANNNTFRRFLLKYGDKTLEQISSSKPGASSKNVFRGPEKDRYVLDPKDHNLVAIDMGHFLAAAKAPLGLGNQAGFLVEIDQLLRGYPSAFQGEDLKSNALGTIFGLHYLNDPKQGRTLAEKLGNFFRDYENNSVLFQPQEQLYGIGSREQVIASNQKVDGSAIKITDQSLSFGSNEGINKRVIDNESETVKNAALMREKEALLKELEELNSLQTNFSMVKEGSAQRTL